MKHIHCAQLISSIRLIIRRALVQAQLGPLK